MRVLVTRPEPGSLRTAAKLAEMGLRPLILPLSRILYLNPTAKAPPDAGCVVLTSANAIRHAGPALVASIRHLECLTVGPATAAAAQEAGFASVASIDGDAAALAREIVGRKAIGSVLYLCGRVRHADLEKALSKANIRVETIETYDTVDLPDPLDALKIATGGEPVQAVLVYSANTARLINPLLDDEEGSRILAGAVFCCISWRVAETLRLSAASRVMVAESQNEPALLAILGSLKGHG